MIYRITRWDELYEINRTRELRKMAWVPLPNRQDGDGYTELVASENGPALYGAWVAILLVASKCDPRGTLLRDARNMVRRPHDAESLARISRMPADLMTTALGALAEIGWIEAVPAAEEAELLRASPRDCIEFVRGWDHQASGWTVEVRDKMGSEPTPADEPLVLPAELDTEEFRAAWSDWLSYRRESKFKKWTPRTVASKLNEMAAMGSARACAAIRVSIGNGWQGIHEGKRAGGAGRETKPPLELTPDQIKFLEARRRAAHGAQP